MVGLPFLCLWAQIQLPSPCGRVLLMKMPERVSDGGWLDQLTSKVFGKGVAASGPGDDPIDDGVRDVDSFGSKLLC